MNQALSAVAKEVGLLEPDAMPLRLAFGLACVSRTQHLLEDTRAQDCFAILRDFVAGKTSSEALGLAAQEIVAIAASHRGSPSIDGLAHAAVSATYALANALSGRAVEAAGYAAYASVYAYGGYAVSDPTSFEPEIAWQIEQLRHLASMRDAGLELTQDTG